MGEHVIKYFTIHCPKCKVLQMLMEKKNIQFEVIDDKDTVMSIAKDNGIQSAPFAVIDERYYNAKELQNWIKEQ